MSGPRIAIACSGLGRVRRGNETWAATVAAGLAGAGADVTLFGGGDFGPGGCPYEGVPNWPRESRSTRGWLSWHHRYLLEQLTFEWALRGRVRKGGFQITHSADPALAWRLERQSRLRGFRNIYKDGLLLGPAWCGKFRFVQVLAPYYLEAARREGVDTSRWRVIPHLADPNLFQPAQDRASLRGKALGRAVGEGSFVVLAVGDLAAASAKRLDWVVREFARLKGTNDFHLVIAGQGGPEDEARLKALGVPEGRLTVRRNLAHSDMAELYPCADVFVHAALREPFGIVFLEAMASGLPILGHRFPVTEWIIGDGGQVLDMERPEELAKALERLAADTGLRMELARRARARAVAEFSPGVVVPRYRRMYEEVMADRR